MKGQASLLVVEDNETNMMIFRDILTAAGHRVVEAITADEALVIAHRDPPDLILMDIQLPGLDGIEAIRRLKRDPATKSIPVVALTAHAMSGHKEKALEAGCSGYITKPIRARAFREEIEVLLAGGGSHHG